jgi:iron(III) transport system ATP-binding protein
MGEANFLAAAVAATDIEGLHLASVDDDATVMLRPDDITFAAGDGGSATVVHAEFRGSTWCYTLRLASGASVRSIRSHLDEIDVGAEVSPYVRAGHVPVVIPT